MRHGEFHSVYTEDRPALFGESGGDSAAASGVLPERGKGAGRGQATEPGKERDGGVG